MSAAIRSAPTRDPIRLAVELEHVGAVAIRSAGQVLECAYRGEDADPGVIREIRRKLRLALSVVERFESDAPVMAEDVG